MDDQCYYQILGPPKAFYTKKEIAALLDRSEATIDRWIKDGKFPRGLGGGKLLWRGVDIACWLYLWGRLNMGKADEEEES